MLSPFVLIGDGEDRVRVRVIDEARRQRGVEERLDAGRGRVRVEQREAHLVDHLLVGHVGEREHALERGHANGGVTRRLDRREVPARALHVETATVSPKSVLRLRLHAGVAAAVEDERVVRAEQPSRVRAQRDELAHRRNAARTFGDCARGIRVYVATVHRSASYQPLQGSGGWSVTTAVRMSTRCPSARTSTSVWPGRRPRKA